MENWKIAKFQLIIYLALFVDGKILANESRWQANFDYGKEIKLNLGKNVRNQRLPQSRIIKENTQIAPLITQMKCRILDLKIKVTEQFITKRR